MDQAGHAQAVDSEAKTLFCQGLAFSADSVITLPSVFSAPPGAPSATGVISQVLILFA
jgi:hypothetical protein